MTPEEDDDDLWGENNASQGRDDAPDDSLGDGDEEVTPEEKFGV